MLILTTDQAVNTFKSKAQITVGAELGVSVGPIGRSVGSDVAASNKGAAHAFSYAQSKGLFFGASLEASGIAARPDVNRAFYGERVSISALLSGEYPSPKGCEPLYRAIEESLFDRSPRLPLSPNSNPNPTLLSPPPVNPRFSDLNQYSDVDIPVPTQQHQSNAVRRSSKNADLIDSNIHEL
jgi:hypothetical protein